jgi:serine O-acetyltransferase
MIIKITKKKLQLLLLNQIKSNFQIDANEEKIIKKNFEKVLLKTEYCFSKSINKYFRNKNKTFFDPFHSDQYSTFLYFFSNTIFKSEKKNIQLAKKIYYLNKLLNSLDLLYSVKMPKVFFINHPVGTVIGSATFGEYFSFSQNCTVGNNKGIYPVIGSNVQMMSGSKILGKCKIGNNVIFSANSYVIDTNIPSNTIVFGQYPKNVLKKNKNILFQE